MIMRDMCRIENDVMDEALVVLFKNCCPNPSGVQTLEQLLKEENLNYIFKLIISGHEDQYKQKKEALADSEKPFLEIFVERIRSFYSKYLNQVITRLPNVENIIKEPQKHFEDTQLLLQLLMGCAIQCHEKFWFYEKIAQLDAFVFFRSMVHLKKLRDLVKEKEPAPETRTSSRILRHFSKSFNFGSKQNSLITNSVGQQTLSSSTKDDSRSSFDCRKDCIYSPIYQIRIHKDQIKQMDMDEKIKKLEIQIKCQTDLIDTLRKDYEAKLNKQNQLIVDFEKDTTLIQTNGVNGNQISNNLTLMENKSKTEIELLYKIDIYNKLLNEVAKEWSEEEVKYKQLNKEVARIKRLIYDEEKSTNPQETNIMRNIRKHSTSETLKKTPKENDEFEGLNCLDLTLSNVPHLIEMFENKNSNQQNKILALKDKILSTNN